MQLVKVQLYRLQLDREEVQILRDVLMDKLDDMASRGYDRDVPYNNTVNNTLAEATSLLSRMIDE